MPDTASNAPAPTKRVREVDEKKKLPCPIEHLQAVMKRVQQGDESALPDLRKMLIPETVDMLGGNLAESAIEVQLTAASGGNLYGREVLLKKMSILRSELAGTNPTAIERLLAERSVCCWFHLYNVENTYASKGSMTLTLADHYQKMIDRAHKRYLSSLKALAEVRKLNVSIQLNIARKQVNVAG